MANFNPNFKKNILHYSSRTNDEQSSKEEYVEGTPNLDDALKKENIQLDSFHEIN